jgi:hypothetical protein
MILIGHIKNWSLAYCVCYWGKTEKVSLFLTSVKRLAVACCIYFQITCSTSVKMHGLKNVVVQKGQMLVIWTIFSKHNLNCHGLVSLNVKKCGILYPIHWNMVMFESMLFALVSHTSHLTSRYHTKCQFTLNVC